MNILKMSFAAVAIAVGSLCLPNITTAQIPDTTLKSDNISDTSRVYTLGEVIVSASRFEEDPQSVGRSVTVINREQIEESLHMSVAELLSEQQSLHIIGGGQTPGSLQQGFIRNTNNRHSMVMIDGVRISDPSTVNNSVDLSELSLVGVQRIEIVRGSHSTLYGSSAIGGVINIITRDRGQRGFNGYANTKHGVFGKGTYATQNNFNVNYSLSNGIYADLGFSQQLSNGMDATIDTVTTAGAFNPQDRDDFRKLDLMAKVGYQTSHTDINISYRNADQTSDLDQGAYSDDDNAKSDFKRNLFTYSASQRFNETIEVAYEGAYSDLQRDFVNDSSMVNARGDYDGTYVETNAEGSSWENSLTVQVNRPQIEALFGIESSYQTMSSRNYIFSRSSFGVFEQTTDLDSLDLKERLGSAFIHAELNGGLIAESVEPFSLVLGGRAVRHNEFGTHYTYEINPKVRLSSNSLVFGALTTGFNAPSLYKLNSPEQGFGAFTSRGNPNLEPETSVSYELGWRQEVGKFLDLELSLFRTEVENVIEYIYLWEGETAVSDLGPAEYRGDTYINISREEINGLEFGFRLNPTNAVAFGGTLSLTHSELMFSPDDINEEYIGNHAVQIYESGIFLHDEEQFKSLTRRPDFSGSLQASYRPISKLQLKVNTRFVGSRDDVFYSANLGPYGAQDRTDLDGYNLTDIKARYQFADWLSVTAKIGNLFNSEYNEITGYRTKGRSILLGASIKW